MPFEFNLLKKIGLQMGYSTFKSSNLSYVSLEPEAQRYI